MGCIAEAWVHRLLALPLWCRISCAPGGLLLHGINIVSAQSRLSTLSASPPAAYSLRLLVLRCVHTNPFHTPNHNLL
ncbi:hypothetical protein B0H11DRAFT_1980305 [Mycena galericulata]|nr:hypothetical protein B0H11DRAFT_1980305 [Mycena galericulata]